MAEKKFFVDINLQGSALTNAKIGTNSGIGSTEGAFGYDSSAHRLQYFDGTATKEVANLSDIAAITGGLILQGGYDPTTNNPNIIDDTTVLKGFFWVVTAAGTFLGQSVQVGDLIIAKIDSPAFYINNWLILQGNIIVATDSVDGISRLATQTEANDGTEAGAVVITPATLQGKIDAQITPEISNKLPLAGGSMSGAIDMGGNDINNLNAVRTQEVSNLDGTVGLIWDDGNANFININQLKGLADAPTDGTDATNKTYVDGQVATALPLAGGTMSGNIMMDGNYIAQASIVGSEEIQTDKLSVNIGANIELLNDLNAKNSAKIVNLPAPTNGGDATNKTYVDDQDALKLSLTGGTMSGNIDMNNNGGVYNASGITTQGLDSASGYSDIKVYVPLDLNSQAIKNLPAPTANGDAANKEYVDTTAATAESNANVYTDTEIAAQKVRGIIATTDWIADGNSYYVIINHNLGEDYVLVQTYEANYLVEFDVRVGATGTIELISNIVPNGPINYIISK